MPDPRVRYLKCGHGHHRWMGSSCPLPCCLGCGLTCAVVAFAKQHERSDSLDHTVLLLQRVWGREALEACAWNSTGGSVPPCVLDPTSEVVYSDALFPFKLSSVCIPDITKSRPVSKAQQQTLLRAIFTGCLALLPG